MVDYTPATVDGDERSHPSYAKINVSRVSGQASLFDSAFQHQHYITLSISRAVMIDSVGHRHTMEREEYIEVAMSETQFARMITSLNMGSGTPCTLQHFQGRLVEQPLREDEHQTHRDLVRDKMANVMDRQKAMAAQLKKWREEKHRPTLKELDELASKLETESENFDKNMAFYAGVFEEHMERITDEAKTEIEAHMMQTQQRLGLTSDHNPLALEDQDEA